MKEAIVLLNMGGPNNLNEVEMFLHNMFNDPYILRMKSKLLRRFVAGMITFMRAEKSQEIYRRIGGKSPLVDHTRSLVGKLQAQLGNDIVVDFAMRYTPPLAEEVCKRLQSQGIEKVYMIPLYPQYSTTTTASSLEDFEQTAHSIGWRPLFTEVKHFFENDVYNQCVIERIRESLRGFDASDYEIIFSAHGLPQKVVDDGDPYQLHVNLHVDILNNMMIKEGLNFKKSYTAYQSKVGPMKWLDPSLEETLHSLEGKKVLIVPLAFTIDNSETDFELHIEYAEVAHELGMESYIVARCANDHPLFVNALETIYRKMR